MTYPARRCHAAMPRAVDLSLIHVGEDAFNFTLNRQTGTYLRKLSAGVENSLHLNIDLSKIR